VTPGGSGGGVTLKKRRIPMATKQLCISADSHVVESADFFKPLVKRFGDQAPRVVIADPDRGPQLSLGNGQLGLGISGFSGSPRVAQKRL
jgi:hypothetical protein